MTDRYQIEALLRPPIELYSVLISTASSALCVMAPSLLMMPRSVGYASAATLFVLVTVPRLRQAWRILRYQRNLRRLPTYKLRSDRVPVSNHKLFVGRGFRWEAKHTQRLRDTMSAAAKRYVEPGFFYRWARRVETRWEDGALAPLARALRSDSRWNPVRPLPPVGGRGAIHAIEPDEQPVFMDLREKVGHTLVLGTTRVGKTRFCELNVTQDIRRGDRVFVFDPKGDWELARRIVVEAKAAGRGDDVYIFDLGRPDLSCRYNAIARFSRVTEVATRIAGQLPSEGNAAAFREFAWRFVNIIARALVALGRRPDYRQIRAHINDIESLFIEYAEEHFKRSGDREWRARVESIQHNIDEKTLPFAQKSKSKRAIAIFRYLKDTGTYDPVLDGLRSAWEYDKTYFDKIVSSLGPLMEKLTTGKVAELLSPDYHDTADERPILDWKQAIRENAIVYVGLDALSDFTVAAAVGNSMFADLVSIAGEIYKHGIDDGLPNGAPPERVAISIHADEFNELIGDEFIPLLNKAGGAGVQVTAYTQTLSDIEARVGSQAKAQQIIGNFNTLFMLRVKHTSTAELLTQQIDDVEVKQLMSVSGVNDSSDPGSGSQFTSRNEDRITTQVVPMITPSQLTQLPKGQAFALLEGGVLHKLRLPLPDPSGDAPVADSFEGIVGDMRERYATNDLWAKGEEPWWNRAREERASAERAELAPAEPAVAALEDA